MLSDHEWKKLREVERHLRLADPGFLRSFDTRARRLARVRDEGRAVKTAIAAVVLIGVLTLATGSFSGALAITSLIGLVWLTWRGER